MKKLLIAIGLTALIFNLPACKQKEKPADFDDLGKISERYRAPKPDARYGEKDLNGKWQASLQEGHNVTVTIDFDAGEYSSDVEGTSALDLSLVSDSEGTVVFKLSPKNGDQPENITCDFIDKDTITMIGADDVPHKFKRVKE